MSVGVGQAYVRGMPALPPPHTSVEHQCNAWCEDVPESDKRQHCDIAYYDGTGNTEYVGNLFKSTKTHIIVVHFEEAKKAPPPGYLGHALMSTNTRRKLETPEELERLGKMRCFRYWFRTTPYVTLVPPTLVKKKKEPKKDELDPYTG